MKKIKEYIKKNCPEMDKTPWKGIDVGSHIQLNSSRVNLIECCKILNKHDVNYRIIFGTLLGLYRDKDLIPYDTDMDIAILKTDIDKIIECVPDLCEYGFTLVRLADAIMSLGKDGDYIDLYRFQNKGNALKCMKYMLHDVDFVSENVVELLRYKMPTIDDPESFFIKYYGKDWRTHIEGKHA